MDKAATAGEMEAMIQTETEATRRLQPNPRRTTNHHANHAEDHKAIPTEAVTRMMAAAEAARTALCIAAHQ